MTSKLFTPSLVVVDVGHGSAAVLRDTDGVVVLDTGKKGPALLEFLVENSIREIESLVLSHADDDHIGNAATLLLAKEIRVRRVFFNSDPTKATDSQQQLQLAILTARRRRNTEAYPGLSSSLNGTLDCGEVQIEILFPPPEALVTGVGGRGVSGRLNTSNCLSAAVRLCHDGKPVVLLGGDVGVGCLDFWDDEKLIPSAQILVFPHHGGAPGTADPSRFAQRISALVTPGLVVFSIHRTRFDLPREDVVAAILKACPKVKLLCTELPERLLKEVRDTTDGPWCLHRLRVQSAGDWWDGHIQVSFKKGVGELTPYRKPAAKRRLRRRR